MSDRPNNTNAAVDAYFSTLEHPYKPGVQALRKKILGCDERIREQVKWNAPSFYIEDDFATFRLHPNSIFQLILHTGARKQSEPRQFNINDPQGWLKWAASNRCILTFDSNEHAEEKSSEVLRMVKEWVAQL